MKSSLGNFKILASLMPNLWQNIQLWPPPSFFMTFLDSFNFLLSIGHIFHDSMSKTRDFTFLKMPYKRKLTITKSKCQKFPWCIDDISQFWQWTCIEQLTLKLYLINAQLVEWCYGVYCHLNLHARAHVGVTPYQCRICGKHLNSLCI